MTVRLMFPKTPFGRAQQVRVDAQRPSGGAAHRSVGLAAAVAGVADRPAFVRPFFRDSRPDACEARRRQRRMSDHYVDREMF